MESPLKPEYDDVILGGALDGAYLTKRYQVIQRIDELSNLNSEISYTAKNIAEKRGADGVVAKGIAIAMLDSLIMYGRTGEEFLKHKLEQNEETFSQEEYSKDIATAITSQYQYDRKQKIIDGVVDALNNDPNNLEANAAKNAIMAEEYYAASRYDEGEKIEQKYLEGKYIDSRKLLARLHAMHYKPISKEQQLKNLDMAYRYLSEDDSRISDELKKEFPDISETRMICYQIANLDDEEMEKLLKLAKKNFNKGER